MRSSSQQLIPVTLLWNAMPFDFARLFPYDNRLVCELRTEIAIVGGDPPGEQGVFHFRTLADACHWLGRIVMKAKTTTTLHRRCNSRDVVQPLLAILIGERVNRKQFNFGGYPVLLHRPIECTL